MAIFGSFETVRAQAPVQFAAVFEYVAEALRAGSPVHERIHRIALGTTERIELGGGAFAMEQVYETKARPDGFFESHRKYIDVQVIVAGREVMEVAEISRLNVTLPYVEERDLIKYGDTAEASRLLVEPGDAVIFYPVDGHMPSLRPGEEATLVRKTVVKVPVA